VSVKSSVHEATAEDQALEALHEEIRQFIAANRPHVAVRRGSRAPEPEDIPEIRAWMAKLYGAGYLGASWPEEHGGRPDAHPLQAVALVEELARAGAPMPIGAHDLASGAIYTFGSDAQKAHYLPRIRRSDDLWCQLFSEPNAGSDLASLQTAARWNGTEYVVNGQKVWTTNGHHADLGFLLARTDPDVPKHAGITAFVLDMRSPGVEVRPLREITGTSDFNEVFFQDVRVPAENVIGAVGDGWRVANETLSRERHGSAGLPVAIQRHFEEMVTSARRREGKAEGPVADRWVRQELARMYARVQVCVYLNLSSLQRSLMGRSTVADAPINKVFSSELNYDMTNLGMQLAGPRALLASDSPESFDGGHWQDDFLYARAYTIAGGSNEVMRNVLGERALGLPREPKP
jgi:alkylation response protein AidB-like acyl-CoA dehydrogenase